MKRFTFSLLLGLLMTLGYISAEPRQSLYGIVLDESGAPLIGATVTVEGTTRKCVTDEGGRFKLHHIPSAATHLSASYLGYSTERKPIERGTLKIVLKEASQMINQVEVFGTRHKQPEKMDYLTRMPLRPSEQIQSISVVSEKMIEQQGSLSLSDVTKNVVGVSTFATYGGASESLSARGFRGIPILKNGVRVHSDFRGQGTLMDMQGVESVQIIKGSAAVTQGIGNDLGSAGGTVNVATKTPHFIDQTDVTLRAGSWGLVRPTIDLQKVYGHEKNFGIRFNGALERSDSYRAHVDKDRIYLNPSLAWKINDKSTLIAEMDYLHDSRTPDRGTVNLDADSVYALYSMPHDRFLGFASDRIYTNQLSYSLRYMYELNNNFSFRIAYVGSTLDVDNTGASTKRLYKNKEYNQLVRSLGRSLREDKNQTFQLDLIGKDLFTGPIKHTFQVGVDYKSSDVATTSYKTAVIDTIDVLNPFTNELPSPVKLGIDSETRSLSYSYGMMAQDVITFHRWVKAVLGVRYSYGNSIDRTTAQSTSGQAVNPLLGVIITPISGVNLFGSYTTTTDLRSAANLLEDGTPIGASQTKQFETGVKTEWLDNRLRVNVTLFHVMNNNLAYSIYNDAGQTTGRYGQAGDLQRKGVEFEASGRPTRNLQLILGYAYLDAQYKNSPAYVNGSAPLNTPKHTANGWVYYQFDRGLLRGLSAGLGAYFVDERPVNDFTMTTTHLNSSPGMKPFNMKPYTTLNASLGYAYKKASINLVFNNLLNAEGYSSYYRGGYINPIDPFNFSTTVKYSF